MTQLERSDNLSKHDNVGMKQIVYNWYISDVFIHSFYILINVTCSGKTGNKSCVTGIWFYLESIWPICNLFPISPEQITNVTHHHKICHKSPEHFLRNSAWTGHKSIDSKGNYKGNIDLSFVNNLRKCNKCCIFTVYNFNISSINKSKKKYKRNKKNIFPTYSCFCWSGSDIPFSFLCLYQ